MKDTNFDVSTKLLLEKLLSALKIYILTILVVHI